jgi:hypothetical protein
MAVSDIMGASKHFDVCTSGEWSLPFESDPLPLLLPRPFELPDPELCCTQNARLAAYKKLGALP